MEPTGSTSCIHAVPDHLTELSLALLCARDLAAGKRRAALLHQQPPQASTKAALRGAETARHLRRPLLSVAAGGALAPEPPHFAPAPQPPAPAGTSARWSPTSCGLRC